MCWFKDDIPSKLAAFERLVHDYENQSTKDRRRHQDRRDDAGDGGHASQRAPHPEQREGSRAGHRCEKRFSYITRTQQYIDSRPVRRVKEHGARAKTGQRQGRQRQRQGQRWKERIVQDGKERRSETVLLLQQVRPRFRAECRETGLKDVAEAEGKPVAAMPHSSDTATAVDVHHGHALCEPRTNMRVFQ